MGYKSILTVLNSTKGVAAVIAAASRMAHAQDAHLEILVLGVDRTQLGYSYVGAGLVVLQAALDRTETEARETENAVRAALAREAPDLRWSLETLITQLGSLSDLVSQKVRFCDLVILPRPYGPAIGPEAEAVVEAALFAGRAPVIVLPDDGEMATAQPRRIVLAWNQSAEAMTAARLAMPLLKAAETVSITVVDPPNRGPERSDPGGLLCQMLVRHGVPAEVSVLARSLPRVSDILTRHAQDIDADLVVMGAYGHSRLREAILGGSTRNMLENARIPVFMAH